MRTGYAQVDESGEHIYYTEYKNEHDGSGLYKFDLELKKEPRQQFLCCLRAELKWRHEYWPDFAAAQQLDNSEARLQAYREAQKLVDIEGIAGLVTQELEQISKQLVDARATKNNLESINRVINEYGNDNIELLGSMPEITSSAAVGRHNRLIKHTQAIVGNGVGQLAFQQKTRLGGG